MCNVICPYCKKEAEFVTSNQFYGKDYGTNLYVCHPCDARVGTHGKGKQPLGTMANKQLRALRMACHEAFDPMWKRGKRREAYSWLQEVMGLSKKDAHIGKFDEKQCFKLLRILQEKNNAK
ncbi:hypothetical protein JYK21_07220 [Ralstonia pickettii]|nr:hypothetical protein [Ralstonia pickettii]